MLIAIYESVNELVHEINISQSIDCNERSRYHIRKHMIKNLNQNELKWNELTFWLRNNPSANAIEVQLIQNILNKGGSVRGIKIGVDISDTSEKLKEEKE